MARRGDRGGVAVRAFRPEDARALSQIFHASVRQAGLRHYSPEQVEAWSPASPDPERYARLAKARTILVAATATGEPVGYGELEADGHLDHLYCRPDVIGAGVGSAIASALELRARQLGLQTVFVEASEAARRLFLRRGWEEVSRKTLERRGVTIHNFTMRKRLAGS